MTIMENGLNRKKILRKNLEAKAWVFWYDFNQNEPEEARLSTEEIRECLSNASIAGLRIMTSKGKSNSYPCYESWRDMAGVGLYKDELIEFFGKGFDSTYAKKPIANLRRVQNLHNEKFRKHYRPCYVINEQILKDLSEAIAS